MCVTKEDAKSKLDRLIETMERLAKAVEASNAKAGQDQRRA